MVRIGQRRGVSRIDGRGIPWPEGWGKDLQEREGKGNLYQTTWCYNLEDRHLLLIISPVHTHMPILLEIQLDST
jgi:hypothetical protein